MSENRRQIMATFLILASRQEDRKTIRPEEIRQLYSRITGDGISPERAQEIIQRSFSGFTA